MLEQGVRPAFDGSGPNYDPAGADEWLSYFRYCSTGGVAWRPASFLPVMEGTTVVEARPLLKDTRPPNPDLAELTTYVIDADGPAVRFETQHPYALGFSVVHNDGTTRTLGLNESVPLTGSAGEHHWQVATRTRYSALRPFSLRFAVRN